jgi:hypothetical protein
VSRKWSGVSSEGGVSVEYNVNTGQTSTSTGGKTGNVVMRWGSRLPVQGELST